MSCFYPFFQINDRLILQIALYNITFLYLRLQIILKMSQQSDFFIHILRIIHQTKLFLHILIVNFFHIKQQIFLLQKLRIIIKNNSIISIRKNIPKAIFSTIIDIQVNINSIFITINIGFSNKLFLTNFFLFKFRLRLEIYRLSKLTWATPICTKLVFQSYRCPTFNKPWVFRQSGAKNLSIYLQRL